MIKFASITIITLLLPLFVFAQQNTPLEQQMQNIDHRDQRLRRVLFSADLFASKIDSIALEHQVVKTQVKPILLAQIAQNDSINIIEIQKIIAKYGYPGNSLVGPRLSNVAWAVIQHATYEIQKQYLPILHQAVLSNELPYRYYAMTLDRILMSENQPQIYGTQLKEVMLKDTAQTQLIFWPIDNPKQVNKRRKQAGFSPYRIQQYAKNFGVKFKNYTLDQIYM